MSQEQPPLRSRRELRQARAEAAPESGLPAKQQQKQPPRTDRVRRVSSGPLDTVPERGRERSSQVRARDRAALRAKKEQADREEADAGAERPTRRQMRLRQLQDQGGTAAIPVVKASVQEPDAVGMTVEQALAARADLAEQAKSHLAKLEQAASTDPQVVDPKLLKEQLALAERAAALNRRNAGRQRQQDPGPVAPPRADPAEASNLGMVTPLEFVKVPGVNQPVMKPPATSYVPVITKSRPVLAPSDVTDPDNVSGRSRVIARAEAAVRAVDRPAAVAPASARPEQEVPVAEFFGEQTPVAASSAHGLDPLDAATAGLARAQKMKYLQYAVLTLGVVALVAGIILIISGMTS